MKVKLIRDKLKPTDPNAPDNIRLYNVDDSTKIALLISKLHEEAQEIANNIKDAYEYADVMEVMEALMHEGGLTWNDVLSAKAEKAVKKGGFSTGLVMVRES